MRRAVARVRELPPGALKLVRVEGETVALLNVRGRLVAFRNTCPHEALPLCPGPVDVVCPPPAPGAACWGDSPDFLTCPWHGWRFSLLTGEAAAVPGCSLRLYPVGVEGEQVFVTRPD